MEKQKVSLFGKILTSFSCIMAIVMVAGKWLELNQIPMLLKNSVQDKYSLFEITDFLDEFNFYLDNSDIKLYSAILGIGAVVVIVLSIIGIITVFVNGSAAKGVAGAETVVSVILVCVFIGSIIYINGKMDEVTYGGIDKLLKSTARPLLLALFSILSVVGTGLKGKTVQPKTMPIVSNGAMSTSHCTSCGAEMPAGVKFCVQCGKSAEDAVTVSADERYCTSCGAKIASNMRFCTSCGAKADF